MVNRKLKFFLLILEFFGENKNYENPVLVRNNNFKCEKVNKGSHW
jgi:hypothetical protein